MSKSKACKWMVTIMAINAELSHLSDCDGYRETNTYAYVHVQLPRHPTRQAQEPIVAQGCGFLTGVW